MIRQILDFIYLSRCKALANKELRRHHNDFKLLIDNHNCTQPHSSCITETQYWNDRQPLTTHTKTVRITADELDDRIALSYISPLVRAASTCLKFEICAFLETKNHKIVSKGLPRLKYRIDFKGDLLIIVYLRMLPVLKEESCQV